MVVWMCIASIHMSTFPFGFPDRGTLEDGKEFDSSYKRKR